LGADVVELCGPKSVTYRVYDFFLEIIPRKKRVLLMLNMDYDECEDPTQRAEDATTWAFIRYASEASGVLYTVEATTHIAPAMHLVRQAYEKVSARCAMSYTNSSVREGGLCLLFLA
jgi:predicted transport protein